MSSLFKRNVTAMTRWYQRVSPLPGAIMVLDLTKRGACRGGADPAADGHTLRRRITTVTSRWFVWGYMSKVFACATV